MSQDRADKVEQMLAQADWVTRLARALAGTRDGDDVAQDTWVDVLRAPLASVSEPRGWLSALVHRRASKLRRAAERRRRREQAAAPHGPLPSAEELVDRLTMQRELTEAVLALDEPYRSTIVLRWFEQLDVEEIAARTGSPRNTVRSRLQRGLQLLRARLDERGGRERWMPAVVALGSRHLAEEAAAAAVPIAGMALVTIMKKTLLVAVALAAAITVTLVLTAPWDSSHTNVPTASNAAADGQPATARVGDKPAVAAADAGAVERSAAPAPAADALRDSDVGEIEPTGELKVRAEWQGGDPAVGIHVYLARSVPGVERPLAEVVTNAAGEAVARVAAGKVLVSSDRGGRDYRVENDELFVDVAAGQRQEAVLRLAAGVDVDGVVHDETGAAVAGARIWLTSLQSRWCAGAFVAESGVDGKFTVRGVPKEQSLGAVADGRAPSKLVDLELLDTAKPPVRVELVLGEPGGALEGRVTDAKGDPVAGAIVEVGDPEERAQHRSGIGTAETWSPRRGATAADGSYRVDGIRTGEQPVEVWGRDFAYWHGKATIVAKQSARLDVTLLRGVTVSGTVTGEDGKPLAGACVRCFPCEIPRPYLQGGQYDYESTFGCPFAIADEHGRYRLFHAASPDLHLFAGPGGYHKEGQNMCWAEEVLHAEPGASIEWNAKVEPGLAIRGVVLWADGTPMRGVFVTLIEPGTKASQALNNDRQGRFRFVHLQKKAYDVSVQVWDPPKGAPPVEAREVWPGGGEIELKATFDAPKKLAAGSVRGTISDVASRLTSTGILQVILSTDRGWRTQSNLEGSSFWFKDVPPGRMRVIAMSSEDPILYGPWVELQPAEHKDLGTLVTEPGGKLVLRVAREAGTEQLEPTIYVTPVGASHGRKAVLAKGATELVFDNMCAGEQRVSAYCKGMASIRDTRCTVTAGAEAAAAVELRAAVEREIVVEYEAAQRITLIRVQDERGGKIFDYAQPRALDRPYRINLPLPLGKFTFLVETDGGGKAETTFEMTSLAENQPPVVLKAK